LESARRSWLLDAYNVLRVSLAGRAPGSFWSEESRAALRTLASRLPRPDDEITLVFDARHLDEAVLEAFDRGGRPRIRRVFAPSADEWIVEALEEGPVANAVVVTADRSLRDRARRRGAEVMTTDAFVALCGGAAARPGPGSGDEES
jgi:hypothetical protein